MSYIAQDAVLGGATIAQIMRSRLSLENKFERRAAAGATAASLITLVESEPMISITTSDIAAILASIPVATGVAVAAGTVTFPVRARAQGSTFAGAGGHYTVSGANGLGIINSITAKQGDVAAEADVDFKFFSTDGLTSPVTENPSQSLSSGTFNAEHSLATVEANSSAIAGVKSVTIRPGLKFHVERVGGAIYPTLVSLKVPFEPVIEVTCTELQTAIVAAITSIVVKLRKRADSGFVAGGTAQHISFTFSGGVTEVDTIEAGDDGDGSKTYRFHGTALTTAVNATFS